MCTVSVCKMLRHAWIPFVALALDGLHRRSRMHTHACPLKLRGFLVCRSANDQSCPSVWSRALPLLSRWVLQQQRLQHRQSTPSTSGERSVDEVLQQLCATVAVRSSESDFPYPLRVSSAKFLGVASGLLPWQQRLACYKAVCDSLQVRPAPRSSHLTSQTFHVKTKLCCEPARLVFPGV